MLSISLLVGAVAANVHRVICDKYVNSFIKCMKLLIGYAYNESVRRPVRSRQRLLLNSEISFYIENSHAMSNFRVFPNVAVNEN